MQNAERQGLGRSLVHAHARRVDPDTEPDMGAAAPWVDTLVTLWISSTELRLDFMSIVAAADAEVKQSGTDAPAPHQLSFPGGVRTETPDAGPTEGEADEENEAAAARNQQRLADAERKMEAQEAAKAAAPEQPADRLSGLVDATGTPLKAPIQEVLDPVEVEEEEEDEGLYPSI